MSAGRYDLIVRAGRVFCSATGLDGPGAVAVRGDRIEAAGPGVSGEADETLEFPDDMVLPGLVDIHAHPAPSSWKYGVDPDTRMLPRGTTTMLSQGDAGAANWQSYRRSIIEGSSTRVRLAISPAVYGEERQGPVYGILEEVDVDRCVAAIEEGGEHVWGVAINAASACTGTNDPREIVARALAIAERTSRPLLYGVRKEPSDWPLAEQLELLRPGDPLTYCFQGNEQSIVEGHRVVDSVWEARERGVLFDLGHGMTSSDFRVAETAIAQGFPPDTISTDQYRRHVGSAPPHDLPRTISKLMAAGMSETDALTRATTRPAEVLGLAGEAGALVRGACADLAVLHWNQDAAQLADVSGATRPGGYWEPVLTVRGGNVGRPNR